MSKSGNSGAGRVLFIMGIAVFLVGLPVNSIVGRVQVSGKSVVETQIQINGVLRVNPANPRYFTDANGRAVYLTGSHTWANLQDAGDTNPPPVFDYSGYLNFLQASGHNFIRLWVWEQAKGAPWAGSFWFTPSVYRRTGPGNALDGELKFDLNQFNQAYFDRLRSRVMAAGEQGIYVSIMLFDGWSVGTKNAGDPGNPWGGHPLNGSNNVNGINGDTNGDGYGYESQTLANPAVIEVQEAYVRKVIDTVNDLDNVLYEICNECEPGSKDWQYHMIDMIHKYEAGKLKQHPVGMTVAYPNGSNTDLFDSPADWISPNDNDDYKNNPPIATGSKVVIVDTDHLWGEGGDRAWVWKSFTRGHNVIYMDCFSAYYCSAYPENDPTRLNVVANLGYVLHYANRIDLNALTPRPDLCSTGYCLANPMDENAEYLVYLPDGDSVVMDLSGSPSDLSVEWFSPDTGTMVNDMNVVGGGVHTFTSPFFGDAVLFIYDTNMTIPTPLATGTVLSSTRTPSGASPSHTPSPPGTSIPCASVFSTLSSVLLMILTFGQHSGRGGGRS